GAALSPPRPSLLRHATDAHLQLPHPASPRRRTAGALPRGGRGRGVRAPRGFVRATQRSGRSRMSDPRPTSGTPANGGLAPARLAELVVGQAADKKAIGI